MAGVRSAFLRGHGEDPRQSTTRPLPFTRRLTSALRVLPDFIMIGAQRSGTSSLYRALRQHPLIAQPYCKEVHYFDYNFHRGQTWYRGYFPLAVEKSRARRQLGRPFLTGEACPYYLFHPLAPERVARALPSVKLLIILRNPADRALSHYNLQIRKHRESLTFEEALDAEPGRLAGEAERLVRDPSYYSFNHQRYSYLARGVYVDQVAQWLRLFPPERVLVIRAEDYFLDPPAIVAEAETFLGLPTWTGPRVFDNESKAYAPIPSALRGRLLEYFRPHNARLEAMLGRDFDWDR